MLSPPIRQLDIHICIYIRKEDSSSDHTQKKHRMTASSVPAPAREPAPRLRRTKIARKPPAKSSIRCTTGALLQGSTYYSTMSSCLSAHHMFPFLGTLFLSHQQQEMKFSDGVVLGFRLQQEKRRTSKLHRKIDFVRFVQRNRNVEGAGGTTTGAGASSSAGTTSRTDYAARRRREEIENETVPAPRRDIPSAQKVVGRRERSRRRDKVDQEEIRSGETRTDDVEPNKEATFLHTIISSTRDDDDREIHLHDAARDYSVGHQKRKPSAKLEDRDHAVGGHDHSSEENRSQIGNYGRPPRAHGVADEDVENTVDTGVSTVLREEGQELRNKEGARRGRSQQTRHGDIDFPPGPRPSAFPATGGATINFLDRNSKEQLPEEEAPAADVDVDDHGRSSTSLVPLPPGPATHKIGGGGAATGAVAAEAGGGDVTTTTFLGSAEGGGGTDANGSKGVALTKADIKAMQTGGSAAGNASPQAPPTSPTGAAAGNATEGGAAMQSASNSVTEGEGDGTSTSFPGDGTGTIGDDESDAPAAAGDNSVCILSIVACILLAGIVLIIFLVCRDKNKQQEDYWQPVRFQNSFVVQNKSKKGDEDDEEDGEEEDGSGEAKDGADEDDGDEEAQPLPTSGVFGGEVMVNTNVQADAPGTQNVQSYLPSVQAGQSQQFAPSQLMGASQMVLPTGEVGFDPGAVPLPMKNYHQGSYEPSQMPGAMSGMQSYRIARDSATGGKVSSTPGDLFSNGGAPMSNPGSIEPMSQEASKQKRKKDIIAAVTSKDDEEFDEDEEDEEGGGSQADEDQDQPIQPKKLPPVNIVGQGFIPDSSGGGPHGVVQIVQSGPEGSSFAHSATGSHQHVGSHQHAGSGLVAGSGAPQQAGSRGGSTSKSSDNSATAKQHPKKKAKAKAKGTKKRNTTDSKHSKDSKGNARISKESTASNKNRAGGNSDTNTQDMDYGDAYFIQSEGIKRPSQQEAAVAAATPPPGMNVMPLSQGTIERNLRKMEENADVEGMSLPGSPFMGGRGPSPSMPAPAAPKKAIPAIVPAPAGGAPGDQEEQHSDGQQGAGAPARGRAKKAAAAGKKRTAKKKVSPGKGAGGETNDESGDDDDPQHSSASGRKKVRAKRKAAAPQTPAVPPPSPGGGAPTPPAHQSPGRGKKTGEKKVKRKGTPEPEEGLLLPQNYVKDPEQQKKPAALKYEIP
ncbi:unnamed protein product [Amoebophrya sp. A120]|nr:unnamed protein product [Amoebophrya sp. A120]|eukprot:GSA120T00000809001.1